MKAILAFACVSPEDLQYPVSNKCQLEVIKLLKQAIKPQFYEDYPVIPLISDKLKEELAVLTIDAKSFSY